MKRRTLVCSIGAAAVAAFAPAVAQAQAYPSKPIKLVVPFGPSSGTDLVARVVAERLGEQMNATIVVENREGAGGVIGTQQVAKAPADGYTILMASNAITIAPHLYATPPFDPASDFLPIAKVASMPLSLVTSAKSPYKTLKELLDHAKSHPGQLSYATSGKGAQSHLEVEQLEQIYGLQMTDVPYKNVGQAMTDTISDQVTFYFPAFPSALPHLRAGKLNVLAVGATKRLAAAPEIPTFAEALGMPGYQPAAWFGFMAPKGTPSDVVRRLSDEIEKAMTAPKVRERIEGMGAEVVFMPPGEFTSAVRTEIGKWHKVVQPLGIRTE